jgi:hypothetical protein
MTLRLTLPCALIAATLGCAQARHVQVMTVMNDGNCRTESIGVQLIDYPTLAELSGARLVDMSGDSAAAPPVHLIAIMPGTYPTAGYTLELADAEPPPGDPLVLEVKLTKPPDGAILAQVVTHPCLVVGVDDKSVRRVRIVLNSKTLGEVDLSGTSGSAH